MPTISVIIPAYSVEKYLDKCMNSVLNQSFTDFEVLLIDDGAKDSTVQLCDKYAEKDTRVKTYHKKNGGLSDARNYGLERISGKYVTFIDSDDYIDDNYLKYMYDLILKENAQICMVQGQLLLENEEPHKFPINVEKCVSTEEAIRMMLLRKEATHTSWGKLYDVSLWENIRFPKGQNYEDYATTYHVFSKATRVVYSDAKLYYYIQRLGSIMHDACSIKTLSVLDVADNVSEYLLTKWPESSDEILDLQAHTYLKNLQQILNSGNKAFLEYQNRIILFIKDNRHKLLTSNRVPLNDKVKIVSLMLGKGVFLKVYNFCDGNRCFVGVISRAPHDILGKNLYAGYSDQDMISIRMQEAVKAANIGSYASLYLLNYASLKEEKNFLLSDYKNLLNNYRPNVIFTFSPFDDDIDHIVSLTVLIEAIKHCLLYTSPSPRDA